MQEFLARHLIEQEFTSTENGKRFVQSSNFGLMTKFDALFLELTQEREEEGTAL